MQAYFMMPTFMEIISRYSPNEFLLNTFKEKMKYNPDKSKRELRKVTSVSLVNELQRLFGYLAASSRKSLPTSKVTSNILDDFGAVVNIGEQKDVGEFNMNFLARVHDALELSEEIDCQNLPKNPMERKELERSIELGLSVLLPIPAEQLNKSFIYNTFFGSFSIVTKGRDLDGSEIELKTSATFSQIIINAEQEDLYKGWEANYYTEIDDFQTPTVEFF
jgi:ubiquitin carboxyl-terminal hydrolase 25/28